MLKDGVFCLSIGAKSRPRRPTPCLRPHCARLIPARCYSPAVLHAARPAAPNPGRGRLVRQAHIVSSLHDKVENSPVLTMPAIHQSSHISQHESTCRQVNRRRIAWRGAHRPGAGSAELCTVCIVLPVFTFVISHCALSPLAPCTTRWEPARFNIDFVLNSMGDSLSLASLVALFFFFLTLSPVVSLSQVGTQQDVT